MSLQGMVWYLLWWVAPVCLVKDPRPAPRARGPEKRSEQAFPVPGGRSGAVKGSCAAVKGSCGVVKGSCGAVKGSCGAHGNLSG